MVDQKPKIRRCHAERLKEAEDQAARTAQRLQRQLHRVDKIETAGRLRERQTTNDLRRNDTRRKIIAGALALEEKDAGFRRKLHALIDDYVTSDRDRVLFGLPPLSIEDASAA